MIPSIDLPKAELLRRLKGLIDKVADPDFAMVNPAEYSQSYARLLNLIERHSHQMQSKFILHNLGGKRVDFLCELTGNIYVRPDYRKKNTSLKSLKEAGRG